MVICMKSRWRISYHVSKLRKLIEDMRTLLPVNAGIAVFLIFVMVDAYTMAF